MNYVYIQSEKPGWFPSPRQDNSVYLTDCLWTVGFYDAEGKWNPESDHESQEKAAARVHFLNGGKNMNSVICPANCEFRDCIHARPHTPYQTGAGKHCDEADTICLGFTGHCQPFPVYTERIDMGDNVLVEGK